MGSPRKDKHKPDLSMDAKRGHRLTPEESARMVALAYYAPMGWRDLNPPYKDSTGIEYHLAKEIEGELLPLEQQSFLNLAEQATHKKREACITHEDDRHMIDGKTILYVTHRGILSEVASSAGLATHRFAAGDNKVSRQHRTPR